MPNMAKLAEHFPGRLKTSNERERIKQDVHKSYKAAFHLTEIRIRTKRDAVWKLGKANNPRREGIFKGSCITMR